MVETIGRALHAWYGDGGGGNHNATFAESLSRQARVFNFCIISINPYAYPKPATYRGTVENAALER